MNGRSGQRPLVGDASRVPPQTARTRSIPCPDRAPLRQRSGWALRSHEPLMSEPMSFDSLGLAPELLRAVADQGYTEPTPVQAEAIPSVLAGRDLIAGAQTGTGKTAALVLPILQILHNTRPQPRQKAFGNMRTKGATGMTIRSIVMEPSRGSA